MSIRIALAATLALAAQPALSATLAEISGGAALSAVGEIPQGVEVTSGEPVAFDDTFVTPGSADAADAAADARGDALSGVIAAAAFTIGDAVALGEALYVVSALVENTTQAPVSVLGRVVYDLTAFAAADAPERDDALAVVGVELLVDGEQVLFEEVVSDVAAPGEAALSDAFEYELTLPALGGAEVALSVDGFAFVSQPAPIPLPAGLPLMAAGLGGLALLRRRASRRA